MGSPSAGSRLGTQFGSYELQELIGVGGMGEVYRAYDTVRERMVALKLLRTDVAADPSYRDRFRRESRIAARLQEPHVIPVHDFGEIDGVLYIDMRLVEGASVKDELRVNGVLPPARAVSIIGAGRRRAGRRARQRPGAPRHQARERPAHPGRLRLPGRLRHRLRRRGGDRHEDRA